MAHDVVVYIRETAAFRDAVSAAGGRRVSGVGLGPARARGTGRLQPRHSAVAVVAGGAGQAGRALFVRLEPSFAEEALDSGCTDLIKRAILARRLVHVRLLRDIAGMADSSQASAAGEAPNALQKRWKVTERQ